jgi:hypothetical protein
VQILEVELDRRTNTVQTAVDSKAVGKLASTCHVRYATGLFLRTVDKSTLYTAVNSILKNAKMACATEVTS